MEKDIIGSHISVINDRLMSYIEKGLSAIQSGNGDLGASIISAALDAGASKAATIRLLCKNIDVALSNIEKSESYIRLTKKNIKEYISDSKTLNRKSKKPEFFSLWVGDKLSPFEWLCLKSYIDYGYDVTLYSNNVIDVPKFIKLKSLQLISPLAHIGKYRASNGTSVAAFSDYFRFLGIKETSKVWIDTDNICLSKEIEIDGGYIFGAEDEKFFSIGVLGLPPHCKVLSELISSVYEAPRKEGIPWGAIGPKLFTRILSENPAVKEKSREIETFYPVHWKETASLFLPSSTAAVNLRSQKSLSIHIWNEVITRSGYCKNISPPEGSFIYQKIIEHDTLDKFITIYEEDSMLSIAKIMGWAK